MIHVISFIIALTITVAFGGICHGLLELLNYIGWDK